MYAHSSTPTAAAATPMEVDRVISSHMRESDDSRKRTHAESEPPVVDRSVRARTSQEPESEPESDVPVEHESESESESESDDDDESDREGDEPLDGLTEEQLESRIAANAARLAETRTMRVAGASADRTPTSTVRAIDFGLPAFVRSVALPAVAATDDDDDDTPLVIPQPQQRTATSARARPARSALEIATDRAATAARVLVRSTTAFDTAKAKASAASIAFHTMKADGVAKLTELDTALNKRCNKAPELIIAALKSIERNKALIISLRLIDDTTAAEYAAASTKIDSKLEISGNVKAEAIAKLATTTTALTKARGTNTIAVAKLIAATPAL